MKRIARLTRLALWIVVLSAAAAPAVAATTCTFTADDKGTLGQTLKLDRKSGILTVDLGAIPKDAKVFRAELTLKGAGRFARANTKPTNVYVAGQADKKLALVGPRFRSLDALDAVRAAVKAGKPLELKIANTLAGVGRLEVSWTGGKTKAGKLPKATGLNVIHRAGQSMIIFTEPKLETYGEFATGADVAKFRTALLKKHPGLTFRIWRSAERITPKTIAKARLVGECGLMTCWNNTYHQGGTGKAKPLRYRVTDGGDPVAWGTGLYAHNPAQAGKAFYAVTVAINGEEDFATLDAGNTTASGVDETVGQGAPILQWIEKVPKGKEWQYRAGPLTRLIYTRWEAWPHSSTPSNPIDYLVAMGDEPKKGPGAREGWKGAYRVEPAPVGLHLHCWGGSLNGGYGWWYNGQHGAVLIASNQIPYDWWTGYHASRGTCKTFGDGFVRPFSMDRTLGFLDWAAKQWKEAPEIVRKDWRKLDLTRVFTAGSSMGGSGAPMYPIRHADRIAWCVAWVGVHVPELSPGFKGSYAGSYGPRHVEITMPDGKTSPWDWFSDVWWLRKNVKAETGLILASNGKSDGGIGWPQAYQFARALQETRRPHVFNWGPGGHGTRTLTGSVFNIDVRTDQTLPAFTNGSLDENIGTGRMKTKAEIQAERDKKAAALKAAGKPVPKRIGVLPTDGDPAGAYNAHLSWQTDNVLDAADAWEMTVILANSAPEAACTVDLTPRRCQRFKTPKGKAFKYTVTGPEGKATSGRATGDEYGLLTLKQIRLTKGANRVKITPAK